MVIHQITERDHAQRTGVRAACPQKNSVNALARWGQKVDFKFLTHTLGG
jgi:hypothetical protein